MSIFKQALSQLNKAAQVIALEPDILSLLQKPDRILQAGLEVRMDDGTLKKFDAYRVQYNNTRGPYKGGIRFYPETDLDEVTALSFWMTIKTSVMDIPLGGAKGGVTVEPHALSAQELERLSRSYARVLKNHIGPLKDIPAPDVNTNSQIMAWIADEYSKLKGYNVFSVVTGKPLSIGGSEGRMAATAQGGLFVLNGVLDKIHSGQRGLKVAIQGFGNAGSHAAYLFQAAGMKIIAVSDSKGATFNDEGLDIEDLQFHKKENGTVKDFSGGKNMNPDAVFGIECDVFVPSALENSITKDNASSIKTKIILELANGPVTQEADEILDNAGVIVIPDVLANAGGVTVSYFEWVQNLQNYYWTAQEVQQKLKQKMERSFEEVWEMKEKHNVNMRTGAYIVALKRLAQAIRDRGI